MNPPTAGIGNIAIAVIMAVLFVVILGTGMAESAAHHTGMTTSTSSNTATFTQTSTSLNTTSAIESSTSSTSDTSSSATQTLSISRNSTSSSTTTVILLSKSSSINVKITFSEDPIARGNTQTIYVKVTNSSREISGLNLSITVYYASGDTTKGLSAKTNSTGVAAASLKIGPNSETGTFNITVTIDGSNYYSSFQVVENTHHK